MPDDTPGLSKASESAIEERLRSALSGAAPQGYPTIGVREKIVGSVRARVRRRQHVAGALAACCLVIAGASAGIASWHSTQSSGNKSAAPAAAAGQRHGLPVANPSAGAGIPAARADCGEVAEGSRIASGCYGVYSRSPNPTANDGVFDYAQSYAAAGASSALKKRSNSSQSSASQGSASPSSTTSRGVVSYRVLVPVGQAISVTLPGVAAEIWSAPAVAPGQGSGASQVRISSEQSGGVGVGSSATFQSSVAVTVLIDASGLPVCGTLHIPCGAPLSTWSLVLEFQKS